jgi:hypothetical protein
MMESGPGILWTTMPLEMVMEGAATEAAVAPCLEMAVDGRMLQVLPGRDGTGTVQRLISGDPQDYLDPRWQPGVRIHLR